MTLKSRLVAAFTLLLIGVIAVLGFVMVSSTRQVLTNQIDETLVGVTDRSGGPFGRFFSGGSAFGRSDDPAQRPVALLILADDGSVLFSEPSGFADDPDPLPNAEAAMDLIGQEEIATIPAADGSLDYRAVVGGLGNGVVEVWAVPLDEVDAAVRKLIRTLVLAGVGVALIGGAITWWTVQRGLKPVDDMVGTATAIAAGDLARRIDDPDPATELGELGAALNEMLTQIEDAFRHEQTANERLKQFVADASHELRTPLAAVKGYTELYRKGALEDPGALDNAVRRISTESSRMERLVADLLLLARLDRGQAMEQRSVKPRRRGTRCGNRQSRHRAQPPGRGGSP